MLGRFGLTNLSPSQTDMDNYNFTHNDNKRLLLVSKFTPSCSRSLEFSARCKYRSLSTHAMILYRSA